MYVQGLWRPAQAFRSPAQITFEVPDGIPEMLPVQGFCVKTTLDSQALEFVEVPAPDERYQREPPKASHQKPNHLATKHQPKATQATKSRKP